jgi:hypothetical protein
VKFAEPFVSEIGHGGGLLWNYSRRSWTA